MKDWLSCRHPFGCQAPGEGCYGPCPVTEAEADEIDRAYREQMFPTLAARRGTAETGDDDE